MARRRLRLSDRPGARQLHGLRITATHENLCTLFQRYVYDFIRKFPTLSQPSKLDFGPARVIVMDLAAVAPTGSAAADRQTEMMYMMARHILGRNFFLRTDHLDHIPAAMRPLSSRPLP